MMNPPLASGATSGAPDREPERHLILSYAPTARRPALAALLALDDALAAILRSSREPMIGQMRLTWWHGALCALDGGTVPAQPVLFALADAVVPLGIAGERLAAMIDGWESLLDPEPLDAPRMAAHATARGRTLFEAAGQALGAAAADPVGAAGEGWALADLVRHVSDPGERALAAGLARERLAAATARRWSRPARALGGLAHAARLDLAEPPVAAGSPRRVARLFLHRLTGG